MAKIYILTPMYKDGNEYNLRVFKRKKDAIEHASFLVRDEDKQLIVDDKRGAKLSFVYNRFEIMQGYEIIARDVM